MNKSYHMKQQTAPEERKLSKQERRNRNKLLKASSQLHSSSVAQPGSDTPATEDVKPSSVVTPGSSVYKRQNIFPSAFINLTLSTRNNFITPNHPEYPSIVQSSYTGFHIDHPSSFPSPNFSASFQQALKALDSLSYYQFDYTQPGGLGTKIAKTFVSRCLVGIPGITYKYLGLRMFSYPWINGVIGSHDVTTAIGDLNQQLIQRSKELNEERVNSTDEQDGTKKEYGSAQFNLTLINRCFPDNEMTLKKEPLFEKEFTSVSWHADSSLDHFSTIAVYHYNEDHVIKTERNNSEAITVKQFEDKTLTETLEEDGPAKKKRKKEKHNFKPSSANKPWKLALRVMPNAEGPWQGKPLPSNTTIEAPAISIELPKECCYYLLDDFNHHHQHTSNVVLFP
jgi:hypothetical protein